MDSALVSVPLWRVKMPLNSWTGFCEKINRGQDSYWSLPAGQDRHPSGDAWLAAMAVRLQAMDDFPTPPVRLQATQIMPGTYFWSIL